MARNARMPDFRGSGALFLRSLYLYVLAAAPILWFCLMGTAWPRLFLGVLVLTLPVALCIGLLLSRIDGFSFDDEQQRFVKPFSGGIPYQRVRRIEINETNGLLQVTIHEGPVWRTSLAYALGVREKARLTAELLKRFPEPMLSERRNAEWKSLSLVMAVIVLMTGAFHYYQYRDNPRLGVVPQTTEWRGGRLPGEGPLRYSVGTFGLSVPKRFALRGKGEQALLFEDAAAKTEIKVVSLSRKELLTTPRSSFLRRVTGLGDAFDVLETTYSARVGVIPLLLKSAALEGLSAPCLFEIRQPALRGFVLQGRTAEKDVARMFLTDSERKGELQIMVSGPLSARENRLPELMTVIPLLRVEPLPSPPIS